MKSIPNLTSFAVAAVLLTGCAGMPDLKNLPTNAAALKNMLNQPAAGGSPSMLETGLSLAKSANEATREIPESEEIAIGENIMTGVLGAAPLYGNERIQRYVNQVGRWVAMHSERPNLPWRFALLDSPLVNAGAAPGGQIYITTGLLFRMRSEAELAGALAHEIAHVVQKHHLKAYQKASAGDAFATGAGALVDSQVKAGSLGREVGKQAGKLAIGEVRTLILLSLGRPEEEQADRMGMVLAARAGYDPYGLPTVIQILQDMSAEQGTLSTLYKTHPAPSDRLASLDKTIGSSMDGYSTQAVLKERFATMILGSPSPVGKPAPKK